MLQLNSYTQKSKKSILRAIKMTEECRFKYLEPQVLMAGIVNEGRDLLSYILQYMQIDRLDFCRRINEAISSIAEFTNQHYLISPVTQRILSRAQDLSRENHCDLTSLEFIFSALYLEPSCIKDIFIEIGIDENELLEAIQSYRGNQQIDVSIDSEDTTNDYPNLETYGINLCVEARNSRINRTIGRDAEIRKIIQILSRHTKNNPILVGEPGTGKTAIVEGLAHRIIEGQLPRELQNISLYSIDFTSLVAGASHMGEFEERLKGVINEAVSSNGKVILFIDEIHLLIGGGRSNGAMDAANILKPELARGKVKIIGATTNEEYKKYIEEDKAFERRFQKVSVEEPDVEAALAILRGVRIRLEDFHNVRIKDDAIKAALNLSVRYIQDRFLPDKAIDLLDEAASKMKISRSSSPEKLDNIRRLISTKVIECESLRRDDNTNPVIEQLQEEISNLREAENLLHAKWQSEKALLEEIQTKRNQIARLQEDKIWAENQGVISSVIDLTTEINAIKEDVNRLQDSLQDSQFENILKPEVDSSDIMEVITEWTGIPGTTLSQDENEKLRHIEEYLNNTVVGQEEAKTLVANAIRRSKLGFSDPNKPIGSFLFLGTTGVGKTELCKALSEYLFDSREAFIRIDMSEYQQEHEVSKLFGAPPGYIGFECGGQLTEAVRRKPYSVVLFDEIEKAHPKVFETLLQVLDDGRMTDGKGRTVNFKNTIIVMTSNLGHQVIYSTLQGHRPVQRPSVGFASTNNHIPFSDPNDDGILTDAKTARAKALILQELKSRVAPEFINRIDDIVMFLPLSKEDIRKIVKLQLKSLTAKLQAQGLHVQLSDEAVEFLVERGYSPEYGARPVKRAINAYLVDDLSTHIINGLISREQTIVITSNNNNLGFSNI